MANYENSMYFIVSRKCSKDRIDVTKRSAVSNRLSGIYKALEFERLYCILRKWERKQPTYFLMV